MIKLYTTDSYFNIFTILNSLLEKSVNGLDNKNVIFSEAKISLMIERSIAKKFGGSFNTDVYSFGKYLHKNKKIDKLLSKEGSAMAIKRILSGISLNTLKASASMLAPSLFDLIIQLKSAGVTPKALSNPNLPKDSALKGKIEDIHNVFNAYEQFIKQEGYDDQSSLLDYLPDIIRQSEEIKKADVYLVGFTSFTSQARQIVKALVESAKSVTAIFTEGDNEQVFVNETASFIRSLCQKESVRLFEAKVPSTYAFEGKLLVDNLFSSISRRRDLIKKESDKLYLLEARNPMDEICAVAESIKQAVLKGEIRYRDVTIAVSQTSEYRDYIERAFAPLGIPYYLDEKKNVSAHPIVLLISSYIDVFRKNFERKSVVAFLKNPYYSQDKKLLDEFENYCIKYNVNYSRFLSPFTLGEENVVVRLEEVRRQLVGIFERFSIKDMFEKLCVEEKAEKLSLALKEIGQEEQSAVNEQVYKAVVKILNEVEILLSGVKLSYNEFKSIFLGGINALEISIIPQYNDAVFIGSYKQTALAKAKRLYAVGLTSSVPSIRQDVSLLSDGEIDNLMEVKVLIEPKISVVNHRTRENLALALGAFSDILYLTYPTYAIDGSKNEQSEVVGFVKKLFNCNEFSERNGYLTEKQALNNFARDLGLFVDYKKDDVKSAYSYYMATKSDSAKKILTHSSTDVKEKLEGSRPLLSGQTSPTTIEDYYRCPFKSFLVHSLKLTPRESDKVDALSAGNIMHDVFCIYAKKIDNVCDQASSEKFFDQSVEEIMEKAEYKKHLEDPQTRATVQRVLSESKRYCYKTYLSLKNSSFKVKDTEVAFGDGKKYPALSLNNGEIRLKGKIDRIDENENFYRIIDYKTGKADGKDKSLFMGLKLQLYLYAKVVGEVLNAEGKKPAGLYYLPVSDKYKNQGKREETMAVGKTLDDKNALIAQDLEFFVNGGSAFTPASIDNKGKINNAIDEQTMYDYIEYAKRLSDMASMRMNEGVIIPSPVEGTCEYCEYKALCPYEDVVERTVGKVKEQTIKGAVDGDK